MVNKREETTKTKDEYAVVLDIIVESGKSFKDKEFIQAIGTKYFTLLELVPKEGVSIIPSQKVYIGDGKRDEILYIKRALPINKLSGSSKSELLYAIEEIVKERESEFVDFFNKAGPVTIRKHSLESIPGIGKKHLQELLESREDKPFESFDDIKERCDFLPNPSNAIAQRIKTEMEGEAERNLFVMR